MNATAAISMMPADGFNPLLSFLRFENHSKQAFIK